MSSNKVVLDASAMLAILNNEPGSEHLSPELLGNAICSAVSASEVQSKLVSLGVPPDLAWEMTLSAVGEVVAFTVDDAKNTGSLIAHTRSLGLSLGDRACLSLGGAMQLPVYTAEKAWKSLKLNVRVQVIR